MTTAKATTQQPIGDTTNFAEAAAALCGVGVLGCFTASAVTSETAWAYPAIAFGLGAWGLLEKRDRDARRAGEEQQNPDQAEYRAADVGGSGMPGQLPKLAVTTLDPGPGWVVHPLPNTEQEQAEADCERGLGVRREPRDAQDCYTGHDQPNPPVLKLDAAHLRPTPTYFAQHGAIWSSSGQRLSITGARDLRRFFLNDVADVEDRFGENDQFTADALQTRDLRLAAELRVAIREACQYEVEPHVSAPVRVPA